MSPIALLLFSAWPGVAAEPDAEVEEILIEEEMEEEEPTEDELLEPVAESQASSPTCAKDQPKVPSSEPYEASNVGQAPDMCEDSQAVHVPSTPETCQEDPSKGVFKDRVTQPLDSTSVRVMWCVSSPPAGLGAHHPSPQSA